MLSFFKKIFTQQHQPEEQQTINTQFVYPCMDKNINYIKEGLYETDDLQIQKVNIHNKPGVIIYLKTMVDIEQLQRNYLLPLMSEQIDLDNKMKQLLASPEFEQTNQLDAVITSIIQGSCMLFFDGETKCYLLNSPKATHRSPDEPENEKAIRGSHKGFIEDLDSNINFVRTRIHNPQLTVSYITKGSETKEKIAILYMNGIANDELVAQVKERIEAISSDMVFSPGYIEEMIEEKPFSPFQQLLLTERPDRVDANLIEGRVAIMTEGSTDTLIVPVTFFTFFQSPDDYNNKYLAGSFFRILRLLSFLGALTLPAIYIAVVGFHFETIPHKMVGLVKGSIESIPFTPLSEALVMTITIELIREAGIRLPSPIGQTIGIVGGLIIGESVVNAGIISNIMVIVIALTAIMSFVIPVYELGNTVRLLSIPVMFGAATLGFVGIIFAFMIISIHMCSIESFGTPYLSPLTPTRFSEFKDGIVRLPSWLMNRRPQDIRPQKKVFLRESREWDNHDQ